MLLSLVLWSCASKSVPADADPLTLDAKSGTMVSEVPEVVAKRPVVLPSGSPITRQCFGTEKSSRPSSGSKSGSSSSYGSGGVQPPTTAPLRWSPRRRPGGHAHAGYASLRVVASSAPKATPGTTAGKASGNGVSTTADATQGWYGPAGVGGLADSATVAEASPSPVAKTKSAPA